MMMRERRWESSSGCAPARAKKSLFHLPDHTTGNNNPSSNTHLLKYVEEGGTEGGYVSDSSTCSGSSTDSSEFTVGWSESDAIPLQWGHSRLHSTGLATSYSHSYSNNLSFEFELRSGAVPQCGSTQGFT